MARFHESSEGERIIEFYLEDQNIKYESEKEIRSLKNDSKGYRIADFYLPKFKVYLEFLGRWNVDGSREQYKEKMNVYKENNISCIYIYPENLGALDMIFRMRLEKELEEKPELKWQLFLFRLWKFKKIWPLILLLWLGFGTLLVLLENILKEVLKVSWYSIAELLFLSVYVFVYSLKLIFFKKKT